MDQLRQLQQVNDIINFNRGYVRRNERIHRPRFNLDNYDDLELHERFRFGRASLNELTTILQPHLPPHSYKNNSITHQQRICVTLRALASGCFQQVAGDTMGVHKSTANRAIKSVVDALVHIAPRFISTNHFDTPGNREFFTEKGLPNVVGSVDGTHIRILAPSAFEPEFINRKGFHSLNVQGVGTGELLFADVVANWAGSTHDSRILSESRLAQNFVTGQYGNDILLGDQGYPLHTWLYTPVDRPNLTPQERRYNRAHKSSRCSVERLFGLWKRRWACLKTGLRCRPERAARIIVACAVLHNFAVLRGEPNPEEDDEPVDQDQQNPQGALADNPDGRAARAGYIINNFR